LRLGVRLLGESLGRIAAVTHRSADEAITGAMKAMELSRSLASMEVEARKERDREAAKKRGFADGDEPVPAPDAEDNAESAEGAGANDPHAERSGASKPRSPPRPETSGNNQMMATPRDQLKSAAKRVKDRHVALRVKNLRFLATLNEEALRTQARLRTLLVRSEGALLPEVSVVQKERLFNLLSQVLDSAYADSARLVLNPSVPPARALERTLGFALSLEHGKDIAMPVDSRTQALKLAALVDTDLLCQVIDGPFRRRLLGLAKRRPEAGSSSGGAAASGLAAYGRSRSSGAGVGGGFSGSAAAAAANSAMKAWEEAAHTSCTRIVQAIRKAVAAETSQHPGGSGGGGG
jgi:hypothetical protein